MVILYVSMFRFSHGKFSHLLPTIYFGLHQLFYFWELPDILRTHLLHLIGFLSHFQETFAGHTFLLCHSELRTLCLLLFEIINLVCLVVKIWSKFRLIQSILLYQHWGWSSLARPPLGAEAVDGHTSSCKSSKPSPCERNEQGDNLIL